MFESYTHRLSDRMISLRELLRRLRMHSTASVISAGVLAGALCGLIIYTTVSTETAAYAGNADLVFDDRSMQSAWSGAVTNDFAGAEAAAQEAALVRERLEEMQLALAALSDGIVSDREVLTAVHEELQGKDILWAADGDYEQALEKVNASVGELGEDVNAAFAEIARLYALLVAEDPAAQKKELFTRLDALGTAILEMQKRQEGTGADVARITEALPLSAQIGDDVRSLLTMNDQTRQSITSLQERTENTTQMITNLTEQNTSALVQISGLAEQNSSALVQISGLAEQNSSTHEKISSLAEQNNNTQAQITALIEQNNAALEQIGKLEEQNGVMREQIASLVEQMNLTSQQMQTVAENSRKNREEMDVFHQRIDSVLSRGDEILTTMVTEGVYNHMNAVFEERLNQMEDRLVQLIAPQ